MNAAIKTGFTRTNPCPVCGSGTKNCSATADDVHFCRGEPQPGWRCIKQGEEFNTYRRDDDRYTINGKNATKPKPVPPPATDWPALARRFAKNLTVAGREEFAAHLRLPASALTSIPLIGTATDGFGEHWTLCEVDAEGVVVGILRRHPKPVEVNGEAKNKLLMKGAQHGIYIGAEWESRPGPIFCPEGASDVLALHVCGLATVARPSARGGIELLTRLFRRVPIDRDIIIIGENDQRPSKVKPGTIEWPGRDGAETTAAKLAAALNRPVKWSLPPKKYKDSREWVVALLAEGMKPGTPELFGEINGYLVGQAQTVGHSADTAHSVEGWPAPIPITRTPNVPAFPVDTLPAWLGQWAEAVALELQVPVDLPAGLALGLVGGGIARKVVVQPRPGFTEPTNLFVMAALPPGERKTQTFKRAIAPVLELERELTAAAAPGIMEAESERRIAEKRVKNIEEKVAKATGEEQERFRSELAQAREKLLATEVPAKPLLYSEDDTPEALKLEIIRQGGRMMVATTEAKCLENITLYSDRPNFDVYLKGHAGDELRSGRVERGRDSITEPALTCILSPQPEVIRGLAENDVLRGRGFLARWFYQLPTSRVGWRTVGTPAVPEAIQQRYHALLRAAWEIQYDANPTGQPCAHVLVLTDEARAEFEQFEQWIEPQLAAGQLLSRLAGWGGKLNGACERLAAILHVGDALGRGENWNQPIRVETVRCAVRLCRDYYIPHAIAAFDLMGANRTLAGARRVWNWIVTERLTRLSKRDAFNAHRAAFDVVDDLQICLDLLERHYLVRQDEQPEQKRPGRKSSPV